MYRPPGARLCVMMVSRMLTIGYDQRSGKGCRGACERQTGVKGINKAGKEGAAYHAKGSCRIE